MKKLLLIPIMVLLASTAYAGPRSGYFATAPAQDLGPTDAPTFANVTLTDLTPNMLVGTGATNALDSVAIGNFVSCTANETTCTDGAGGTLTVGTSQPVDTAADFQVSTLRAGDGAAGIGAGAIQFGAAGYFGLSNSSAAFTFSRAGFTLLKMNGTYLNSIATGLATLKHSGFTNATLPAHTFLGDTDSGLYRADENEVAISAGALAIAKFSNTTASDNAGLAMVNGTLRLAEGDWLDIPIPLSNAKGNPSNTPTYGTFIGNTSSWSFAVGDIGDFLDFVLKITHNHKIETDMFMHIHINPNNSANSGNVLMAVECTSFASEGEAFSAATTIYNGVQAIDGTLNKQYTLDLGTVAGAGITFGEMANCSLTRRAASGEFVDPIFPLVVGLHIRVDSLGADFIDSKTDY